MGAEQTDNLVALGAILKELGGNDELYITLLTPKTTRDPSLYPDLVEHLLAGTTDELPSEYTKILRYLKDQRSITGNLRELQKRMGKEALLGLELIASVASSGEGAGNLYHHQARWDQMVEASIFARETMSDSRLCLDGEESKLDFAKVVYGRAISIYPESTENKQDNILAGIRCLKEIISTLTAQEGIETEAVKALVEISGTYFGERTEPYPNEGYVRRQIKFPAFYEKLFSDLKGGEKIRTKLEAENWIGKQVLDHQYGRFEALVIRAPRWVTRRTHGKDPSPGTEGATRGIEDGGVYTDKF